MVAKKEGEKMKKALIFILGWTPLLAGTVMNEMIMADLGILPPFLAVAVGTLLVWALFGALTVVLKEKRSSLLLLDLPAAIVLLLVLYQELAMQQYWGNAVGMGTQLFYLPVLGVGFRLTAGITHTMSPVYVLSFLLLCAASLLGRLLGERRLRA